MKKTIAAVALLASSSALAMPIFNEKQTFKKVCLKIEKTKYGKSVCDATYLNEDQGAKLGENGCAKGQIPLVITVVGEASVASCMPPGVAQL